MLNFTKDYPKAETVTLDVNYRCSGRILSSALRLIGSNKKRFQKNLSTPNQEGSAVTISEYQNPREEYLSVVARLRERLEKGDDLKDTALLLRTNQEAEGAGRSVDGTAGAILYERKTAESFSSLDMSESACLYAFCKRGQKQEKFSGIYEPSEPVYSERCPVAFTGNIF